MGNVPSPNHALRAGLCADCRFMRLMHSDRGSTFFLCERSATDESFPKYPRLPNTLLPRIPSALRPRRSSA